MLPCNADGTMGPWDNVMPYYMEASLPGAAAGRTFELRLQGWHASAMYTVKPQTVEVRCASIRGSSACVLSATRHPQLASTRLLPEHGQHGCWNKAEICRS